MTRDNEILGLKRRIRDLSKENSAFKKRICDLETRIGRARGLAGEEYVAELTGGKLTEYKCPYDVVTRNGTRIEVKLSQPTSPSRSKTKRWTWHSPLGLDNTKGFDVKEFVAECGSALTMEPTIGAHRVELAAS